MLKYLLPLVLFLPTPSLAQYTPNGSMCVRTKKTVIAGSYDQYGRWRNPYSVEEDRVEPCYKGGYVAPVGRPAMTESTTQPRRYYGPNSQYPGGYRQYPEPVATQSSLTRAQCRNRSILAAATGGGVAASLSKKNAYAWAIPLGAVAAIALARSGECADLR
jgi:hypothetical protein